LIPYFELRTIHIGSFHIEPFGLLMGVGAAIGYYSLRRRLRQHGLGLEHLAGMMFWMFVGGLAGAALLKPVYHPAFLEILSTAPLDIFRRAGGIASFGGLFAGLLIGYLYLRASQLPAKTTWGYMDSLAFIFPRAWIFGRIGCALAHDHPGVGTESWLGVQFPDGPRYDLGLIEVLYLLIFLVALKVMDRRPRYSGFYLGMFLLSYGIFRAALDTLHEAPVRYLTVTVDQYASAVAIIAGAILLIRKKQAGPAAPRLDPH
jgi:phosphatidylglycerol---prolipoprotein diacylglyceryl transferase